MPKDLPSTMEEDMVKPNTGETWMWLCEISVSGYSVKRYARNTRRVIYNGQEYEPQNMDISGQCLDAEGSIPQIVVRLAQTEDRTLENMINETKGCEEDGTMKLIKVSTSNLSASIPDLEAEYDILFANSDYNYVYFTLGIPNPLTEKLSAFIGSSKICPYARPEYFKGPRCQYTGSETSCKGTLTDCRDNKNNADFWGGEIGLDPNVARI